MNKQNHFLFSKLLLGFLFLVFFNAVFGGVVASQEGEAASTITPSSVAQKPSSEATAIQAQAAQVVWETNVIENKATKNFYAGYCSEKDIWFGIELVTQDNVEWWKERLAYEAYMLDQRINPEKKILPRGEEFYSIFLTKIEANKTFMALIPKTMSCPIIPLPDLKFGFDMDAFKKSLYEYQYNQQIFFQAMNEYREHCEFIVTDFYLADNVDRNSYFSAWLGFAYNLAHYAESPTWVAYVLSDPTNGPLYLTHDVATPVIKMAMTIQVSKNFYAPLGIYRSPIADVYDKRKKLKNISMLFHSFVAHSMKEVSPAVQYVVVRPLRYMRHIFETSGVVSSKDDQPYVRYNRARVFSIFDPGKNIDYRFSPKHWFMSSPFLGGTNLLCISGNPFVTIKRIDLENCAQIMMEEQIRQQLEKVMYLNSVEIERMYPTVINSIIEREVENLGVV